MFYISNMPISLIIFEDNDHLRESLVYLFKSDERYKFVNDYSNCNEAAAIVRVYEPDVVLMDIDMPGTSGVEGVKQIKEARPQTAVVMYTVIENDEKLFNCLCAGANGYILKTTPPAKLLEAIKEVAEGGSPMTPSIAAKVLKMFKDQNPKANTGNNFDLSSREKEILSLLVDGLSYKLIAGELFVSYETVHSHVKNIYQKLHVNSVNEAISKALRNKLV